jgi:hypothetical protein
LSLAPLSLRCELRTDELEKDRCSTSGTAACRVGHFVGDDPAMVYERNRVGGALVFSASLATTNALHCHGIFGLAIFIAKSLFYHFFDFPFEDIEMKTTSIIARGNLSHEDIVDIEDFLR